MKNTQPQKTIKVYQDTKARLEDLKEIFIETHDLRKISSDFIINYLINQWEMGGNK